MFVAQRGIGGIVTDTEQHTQGTPEWVETRDGRRLYAMVLAEKTDIATATVVFEAAQSPHGRHVIAEQSSHYVVATEPELIVAEIERMMPPV